MLIGDRHPAAGEARARRSQAIYKFTLSDAAKLAAVLSISIPYYLSGLSIAIAFRAGVFNIGNEGQYFVGGMIGALAGIYLPLPPALHIPVVVLAAMLGGALWALVPAVLKAARGIHEVITTIMFNNIALALVNYLVNGPLSGLQKGVSLEPQTKKILPGAVRQAQRLLPFHRLERSRTTSTSTTASSWPSSWAS